MFQKITAALTAALLLAGCQSTVTPLSVGSAPGLTAAGFSPRALPGVRVTAGTSASGASYYCEAKNCGSETFVFLGLITPSNLPGGGLTLEEAVKIGLADAKAVEGDIQRRAVSDFTSGGKVFKSELVSAAFNTRKATLDFRLRFTSPGEQSIYLDARGRLVGNTFHVIMSISQSASSAARYARTAWIP